MNNGCENEIAGNCKQMSLHEESMRGVLGALFDMSKVLYWLPV